MGDLDASDTEAIELHIDHCDGCTEILKSLAADVPPQWRAWWQEVIHDSPPSVIVNIGRYTVKEELGRGGFGTVYRCYDRVLMHDVAIKVPHAERVSRAEDVDAYLDEARRWICLDHPGIARFLHADCVDGSCYLVTKFIPGLSLADRMRRSRPSFAESAKIVAEVARTLHYVHEQELYHRDVKPSNILLDANDRPFLTDFGLALAEAAIGPLSNRRRFCRGPREMAGAEGGRLAA